jgi:hypothetical protein
LGSGYGQKNFIHLGGPQLRKALSHPQTYDPSHPNNSNRTTYCKVYYICRVTILKKILLTILCIQFLFPNDLLQDIIKLPILVAHYFHHNHKEKYIHFTDFIADHYSNHEHHDKDHDNHNNLPFHNHDFNFQQSIFTITVLDVFPIILTNYTEANSKKNIMLRQHFYKSSALSSIWRPPKFA